MISVIKSSSSLSKCEVMRISFPFSFSRMIFSFKISFSCGVASPEEIFSLKMLNSGSSSLISNEFLREILTPSPVDLLRKV